MIYDPPKIMKVFPKVEDAEKELHSEDKKVLSIEEENDLRNNTTKD